MICTLRTIYLFSALLLLPPSAAYAQNRWVVGPGGFSSLEAAYQAAAPGDVVLIRVPNLRISSRMNGKGVRIIGDGVRPRIEPFLSFGGVPSGQILYLENLWLDGFLDASLSSGLLITNKILVQRIQMDVTEPGFAFSQGTALLCDSDFYSQISTQWPCVGRPVSAGVFVANGDLFAARCFVAEGPTGVFQCGRAPLFDQRFSPLYSTSLLRDSPYVGHFAILGCTLAGTGAIALRHERRSLHFSGARPYGSIRSDAGTFVDYGSGAPHVGTSIVRRDSRPLPSLSTSLAGSTLQIRGQGASARAFVFLVADVRGACLDGSSRGVEGTLAVDPASNSIAILDVIQADTAGAWLFSYPVSAAASAALEHQVFIVQCLAYEGIGMARASEFGIVRF
jgi:hypothetical protein